MPWHRSPVKLFGTRARYYFFCREWFFPLWISRVRRPDPGGLPTSWILLGFRGFSSSRDLAFLLSALGYYLVAGRVDWVSTEQTFWFSSISGLVYRLPYLQFLHSALGQPHSLSSIVQNPAIQLFLGNWVNAYMWAFVVFWYSS